MTAAQLKEEQLRAELVQEIRTLADRLFETLMETMEAEVGEDA